MTNNVFYKVGTILKPREGKKTSNYTNILDIASVKVVGCRKTYNGNYYIDALPTYKSGRVGTRMNVYSNTFEPINTTDDYEVY